MLYNFFIRVQFKVFAVTFGEATFQEKKYVFCNGCPPFFTLFGNKYLRRN